jgi:hypothetical protein
LGNNRASRASQRYRYLPMGSLKPYEVSEKSYRGYFRRPAPSSPCPGQTAPPRHQRIGASFCDAWSLAGPRARVQNFILNEKVVDRSLFLRHGWD